MAAPAPRRPGVAPAQGGPQLRMRDLVRETGLPRETIHFYLAQGLLPPPRKTGRNTAVYGPEHVERLRHIRELQAEHFLPLRAIKAIFAGTMEPSFTPEQVEFVRRVRASLREGTLAATVDRVRLAAVAAGRVSTAEIRELAAAGLIEVEGTRNAAAVSADDAEVVAIWAALKELGVGPARGFGPSQLKLYDLAMERLVQQEAKTVVPGYADASGPEALQLIERATPLVARLLAVLHRKKVRRFIADFR